MAQKSDEVRSCTPNRIYDLMIRVMEPLTKSMVTRFDDDTFQWFVLRDLKRSNAKMPAYKLLRELNFEVFTPMTWKLVNLRGKKTPQEVPVIPSLLFVNTSKKLLDEVVDKTSTLQYYFLRGTRRAPMVVPDDDMNRFIHAVKTSNSPPHFYLPDELTLSMIGKKRTEEQSGSLSQCHTLQ